MKATFTSASALTLLFLSTACTRETAAPLAGAWRSNVQFESGAFAEIKDPQFMYVFTGRGVLTERIELSSDGQTFTSTIQYEAFGKRGEPVEGGGTARGTGVRIGF